MHTVKRSVIPDAVVLVEEWERAAAGRSEGERTSSARQASSNPGIGAVLVLLSVLLTALAVKWLCGC